MTVLVCCLLLQTILTFSLLAECYVTPTLLLFSGVG